MPFLQIPLRQLLSLRLLVAIVTAETLSAAGCDREVTPRLATSGIDREGVQIDIKPLGKLTDEEVANKSGTLGVDGTYRVPAGTCEDTCDWAQVSVYIENKTAEPMAPPVIRVDTPAGQPKRPPLGLGAASIDPGRIGRIRWLIELYPEEANVDIRLSSSVFFEVTDNTASDDHAADATASKDGATDDTPPSDAPSTEASTAASEAN